MEINNHPKISVITVSFNVVKEIEKTILSVLNQTYGNIEYIIIDGGSSDGTVDIIKKYADRLAYWVSEPDGGIYYGMNKGIKAATGEWIQFLNSGDYYYSNMSLENLMNRHDNYNAGVIYGYQVHRFPYGDYVRVHMPLSNFDRFMPIGHPSTLVKSSLIKAKGFDTRYRIAADYNMLYHLYKNSVVFESVQALVSVFDAVGGVSSVSDKTLIETARVNGRLNDKIFKKELYDFRLRMRIKRLFSVVAPKLLERIQEKKRVNNQEYIPLNEYLKKYGV